MPEKLGVVIEPEMKPMDAVLQATADKTGATIVAGVVRVATPLKYNEARVYVPHMQVASYDKEHMLPPFESDLKPGKTLTLLPRTDETVGVAICKDMDFARPARSYGEAGAGVVLVPAWDFFVDNAWHGHIAVMRGVENGFSIVRSAKGGYLTVSDWRGRIIAETRSDSAPFATLIADVPAQHHATIYQKLGDWFAWLSLGLLAFVLARAFLPG
jgi:Apolipoprotein N-acyltransferase